VDYNVAVIAGTLAAPPEIREFDSGSRLIRFLITTRVEEPRHRVDVVPVTLWEPDDALVAADLPPGQRMWAAGALQRRYWSGAHGRQNRLEFVAHAIQLRDDETEDADSRPVTSEH
jgi:single-stranded DNA-binding protein